MRSDLRAVLGRGLVLLNLAAALTAAGAVVVAWWSPSALGVWDDARSQLTLQLADRAAVRVVRWAALALLLADLLFVLYGRTPRAPLRHIVSETRSGTVLITREAVEAGLRAAGEALPEVSRLRVTVRQIGRRLLVHAWFSSPENASIPLASQALRHTLRQRFEAMVQMPDSGRVEYELEFSGFSGRSSKKAVEAPPDADSGGQPFTGPQYPIDEEDDAAGGR